ncbi:DEAD/DEAH box helicase [Pseudolabrys sp. FHR47]|uniref:DEAD/DEAH box helicase n=1 Tax=Pseudolabrys sp. FHR47 TaxID=2562284 RepID=UPI0010BF1DF3|nr:DEAD/DEAH box helicase [Pseudolabrys sp. FHR47]
MSFMSEVPPIARALAERNYAEPTPVQKAVLTDSAVGRDLLVSAQTGSGKTVAYGLAIAADLLDGAERFERAAKPLALVVAPTRELAIQVQRELTWLYQHCGARVVSCVGGMDPRREQRELTEGAHIVVGTPGRLCDHLRRNRLDLSELKAIVLDEADEMLNLGFREDMELLLEATPAERRTLLFSATLPRGIVALARQYQKDAFRVEVRGDDQGHADIEYRAIRVAAHEVEHAVVNILRFYEAPSTLVFCNTRSAVKHLQAALLERGFLVVALSGELTQNERTTALQSLRDGRARVCVATDVAARGIDLPGLSLVIHAELPNDPEVMQHRSGRTGRAGKKGVSVLLVPNSRRRRAEMFFKQAGVNAIWAAAPQADEIRKLDQQRMMQDEVFTEPPTEDDLALARILLAEKSAEEIASALARLYRARLPAPEDVLDPGSDRDSRFRDDRNERHRSRDRAFPASDDAPPRDAGKRSTFRRPMEGGSVWFKAGIGRRKNAEARWLLPMICRRGGISKGDIGAIKIYDTVTEFEISGNVADKFAAKIQAPDAEENIRIEPLPQGPQGGGTPSPRDGDRGAPEKKSAKPHFKQRQQEHLASAAKRERDESHFEKLGKKPEFKKGDFKKPKFKKSKKDKHRNRSGG